MTDMYIYNGTSDSINKNMSVVFHYDFQADGKFQTIKEKNNKTGYIIRPSYAISVNEGGPGTPRLFIGGNKYNSFVSLLDRGINLVSENLFEIFPNINKIEFEVDSRVLERYKTEKALFTAGMTVTPCVWTNETSECFPGIQVTSKNGSISIPLEDAIPVRDMLKQFDPIVCSIAMLKFFGKIE